MEEQQLNQSFIDVIETNLIIGGMVGGFGDDYGRTAGAHSIHDALTLSPDSAIDNCMETKWRMVCLFN